MYIKLENGCYVFSIIKDEIKCNDSEHKNFANLTIRKFNNYKKILEKRGIKYTIEC